MVTLIDIKVAQAGKVRLNLQLHAIFLNCYSRLKCLSQLMRGFSLITTLDGSIK